AAGVILGIAGGAILLPVAAPAALATVGFTTSGVAAGSLAAAAQSVIYGGATTGLFSVLQSAGATAAAPVVGQAVAGVGLAGAAAAAAIFV
ncbi:hypothetical protein P691DRAFT_802720, partial [Macrolepiota fuliginosa MF-IS2]